MNYSQTLLCFVFILTACGGSEKSVRVYTTEGKEKVIYINKIIPSKIEDAALEALSHYPALAETQLEFHFEEKIVNSFMQAQPEFFTVLQSPHNRKYVIKMTSHMLVDDKKIPIEELPHDVLIGWLGHELGHIMDYLERNSLSMIWFGANYLCFDRYKIKAESRADVFAIRHGLAQEIIATKNYILNSSSLPEAYKTRIRDLYLSPEEILEFVKKIERGKVDTTAVFN